jgi:hypothetical protein
MSLNLNTFCVSDTLYADQLSQQLARTTSELSRLEKLLLAGRVDRQILIEFREVINRVRRTVWAVYQNLDDVPPESAVAVNGTVIAERTHTLRLLMAALLSDVALATVHAEVPESLAKLLREWSDQFARAAQKRLQERSAEI